jgi:hypothetical protein
MKATNALVVLAAILLSGCATRKPEQASEQEFLQRYRDEPLTPEGMTAIMDDRNKIAGKKDTTDYAQAYDANATDGMTRLRILEALDKGDIPKAKRLLMTTMNIDAGFLPVFGARAKISKEKRAQATKFARGYLDYLAAHTNEIAVGRLDFTGCFIGLGQLLEDSPEDMTRLTNLIQRLNWPHGHKDPADPGGPANRSLPVGPEPNRVSPAAGSGG